MAQSGCFATEGEPLRRLFPSGRGCHPQCPVVPGGQGQVGAGGGIAMCLDLPRPKNTEYKWYFIPTGVTVSFVS